LSGHDSGKSDSRWILDASSCELYNTPPIQELLLL
jgi:hypothetical protein